MMDSSEKTADNGMYYVLKCTKCGREYRRDCFTCVMQKVNAYRCNCGGKLEVYQEQIGNPPKIWK